MSQLLKSGMVGNGGTQEQILKNWENSGLLEGLDSILKLKVALTLEDAAKILLQTSKYVSTKYDVVAFPVIRRTISIINGGSLSYIDDRCTEIAELITADFILSELNRIYDSAFETFSLIYDRHKVDVEAETAAFVSERIAILYMKEFKDKNILKKFDINGQLIVAPKPLID